MRLSGYPNSSVDSLKPENEALRTTLYYAFVVLIFGGGAGVWLPWAMPGKTLGMDVLTTYVMATLSPIVADLLLDVEIYGKNFSKMVRMRLVALCAFAAMLAIIALFHEADGYGLKLGIGAVVISILVWFEVATKSERFRPTGIHVGSIGGITAAFDQLGGEGIPD
ncbi:hypothetical protein [Methylocaldum gracile]|jgi:hypothetical protein